MKLKLLPALLLSTVLYCSALPCIIFHSPALSCTALNCPTLLPCLVLPCITLHCPALSSALYCPALSCTTLHCKKIIWFEFSIHFVQCSYRTQQLL